VLVPQKEVTRIAGLRFDSVVVANPGARQGTEFARASVRATAERLLRPDPARPPCAWSIATERSGEKPVRQ